MSRQPQHIPYLGQLEYRWGNREGIGEGFRGMRRKMLEKQTKILKTKLSLMQNQTVWPDDSKLQPIPQFGSEMTTEEGQAGVIGPERLSEL